MITNLIVTVLLTIPRFLLDALPSAALPGWLTGTGSGSLVGSVSDALNGLWGLNQWLPISELAGCAALLFSLLAVQWTVKGLRIVASFLTGGGGNA